MAVQTRRTIARRIAPLLAGYLAFGVYWGVWVVVFADFLRTHHMSEGLAGVELASLSLISIVTMTSCPRGTVLLAVSSTPG